MEADNPLPNHHEEPTKEPTEEQVEQAIAEQQALVDSSLTVLFDAYDEARNDGVATPVVVLLDCEDPLGAQIARAWLGEETVEDAIAETKSDEEGATTVFAAAFDWEDSRTQVPLTFPYLAEAFEMNPPEDGFLTIGVTAGGASAFTAPFDARPE